ncbi:Xaa-Pro aminopeptidase [Gammaproteobacteria bacterium]|nr:Xaa-Pro aminopeptidase [Gammaproteobacteria bacterium]MDC0509084.1 Xaa-Pro aminopeptidase [Gammaproteobacteria bacterium]MDC0591105.1 Xaa-Pro aminopeptidase [Gammaproteobacteria bacterium]
MTLNFSERRDLLADKVLEDSAIIVSAASVKSRISDTEYSYRQDSNFYYLSGYEEPESLILIRPNQDKERFVIFCRDRDPLREQWDGFRTGQEGVIQDYGADAAYSINSIDEIMPKLLEGTKNIYFSMSAPCGVDAKISSWVEDIRKNTRSGAEPPQNLLSLDSILHEMRLIKESDEMDLMKKAANITTEAHIRAMQSVRPGMYEYQLEAEYLYAFNKNGARSPAYNSIVGGGNNSCILHYVENNAELKDGDLVLVDAGCEYQYYASDVTRTFPVNGKFSPEQREIYSIVLEAHKQSMEQAKPGNKWNLMHEKSVEVIVEGLLSIGLLQGSRDEIIDKGEYSKFYMHRIGHWLGMDVHDVGSYKQDGDWRPLEEGMVMTVEPGIYILDSMEGVDDKWKGIGVRIEDDIAITESGFEILTPDVPRTIEEVEQTVQG